MNRNNEHIARRVGLDRAWSLFPQDVADAIAAAAALRTAFQYPGDPADEPTPGFQVDPS